MLLFHISMTVQVDSCQVPIHSQAVLPAFLEGSDPHALTAVLNFMSLYL